jgi:protein phosphatase
VGSAAGRIAVRTISDELGRSTGDSTEIAIRRAFARASAEVRALSQEGVRAGATVVLLVWPRGADFLSVAHLGNCRAHRLRGGLLRLLTEDHDLVTVLARRDGISRQECLQRYRFRNVLVRFLGADEPDQHQPDVQVLDLQPGDRFLLSSDGLHNVFTLEQIKDFLRDTADVQECADGLAQQALDHGSCDNVSCVVVAVE